MTLSLSLGPVFFNWPPDALRDFYFRVADEAPVDHVYLGEVVCSKRTPFFAPYLAEVAERLAAGGKQLVFSSLALITTPREAEAMRGLTAETNILVEVNDLGLVPSLRGRPHAIGPFVNVYNEATRDYLAGRGAMRICLPPELPASSIAALARQSPVEIEVLAFGRIPLAISARCFHARAHGLHKDGCQFVCGQDPDGLTVRTLDADPFLAVNGTQTLSHAWLNLAGEVGALGSLGVRILRISPQRCDVIAVARVFRELVEGRMDRDEATSRLVGLAPEASFCNGFLHDVEGLRSHDGRLAVAE
jgi:collagenase-like PrtC family protease